MLKITDVKENSVCEEAGIKPGDFIVSFKGFKDCLPLDISFFDNETKVTINLVTETGERYKAIIEKNEDEPLGLEVLDDTKIKTCKNNCKFCFVSQLPRNLRKTLYLKDDDFTSSFLFGNYITLTNLSKDDFKRITKFKLSPMYISVHAINDKVRNNLLNNTSIKNLYGILKKFAKNNVYMHTQVVLCEGYNDGEVLTETILKLSKLYPFVKSLAIVPVGLTQHRENLTELKPISKALALNVINETREFNKTFFDKNKENFVFAADEFYVKADEKIEDSNYYGSFSQFENGVGMLSKFSDEFYGILNTTKAKPNVKTITMATGVSAYDFFAKLCTDFSSKFIDVKINVVKVTNHLFGETVTVAGLLSGNDYYLALKDLNLGEKVLISKTSLKESEDIFLDDMSLSELSEKLNIDILPVENSAESFINALLG